MSVGSFVVFFTNSLGSFVVAFRSSAGSYVGKCRSGLSARLQSAFSLAVKFNWHFSFHDIEGFKFSSEGLRGAVDRRYTDA